MSNALLYCRGVRPQTAAYIAAMAARPPDAEILVLNRAIAMIVDSGAFDNMDALYFLASSTDQASRINVISPGTYNLTKTNSPRFTANVGWDANSSSGYLDTGFNPATAGGKFTQNSACMGVSVSATAATNPAIGNTGTGNSFVTPVTVSNTFAGRLSSAGSSSSANTGIGFFSASRATSATIRLFKNADQLLSGAVPTNTLASSNIGILSDNSGGRYANGVTVTMAFFGRNLTGRQMLVMYQAYAVLAAFYGIALS